MNAAIIIIYNLNSTDSHNLQKNNYISCLFYDIYSWSFTQLCCLLFRGKILLSVTLETSYTK